MSQRKQVRHALVDLLSSIVQLETRVHRSRSVPVNADDEGALPCLLVYTDREASEAIDDFTKQRSVSLRVVVIVRAENEADGLLDDLCEAVEQQIERAFNGEFEEEPSIVGLVDSCDFVDTSLTYVGDEGRAELVHAVMTFNVGFTRTLSQNFPDLNRVAVQFDMASPRNDPQIDRPDGQTDASLLVQFESQN